MGLVVLRDLMIFTAFVHIAHGQNFGPHVSSGGNPNKLRAVKEDRKGISFLSLQRRTPGVNTSTRQALKGLNFQVQNELSEAIGRFCITQHPSSLLLL